MPFSHWPGGDLTGGSTAGMSPGGGEPARTSSKSAEKVLLGASGELTAFPLVSHDAAGAVRARAWSASFKRLGALCATAADTCVDAADEAVEGMDGLRPRWLIMSGMSASAMPFCLRKAWTSTA